MLFCRISQGNKGVLLLYSHTRQGVCCRTGVFLEREFVSRKTSGSKFDHKEIQDTQTGTDAMMETEKVPQDVVDHDFVTPQEVVEQQPVQAAQALRRSDRTRHQPERYSFLLSDHSDVVLVGFNEPTSYQEAVQDLDYEKWLEAMRSEMESMYTNQVWTLVDPPEGVKPIGCKWVFKRKSDMDGLIYKGRLVAKGFKQIHGIDYDETFSPIAMFKSIRIMLAIAAYHDYEIWQMDVKITFLNGNLLEDVYMTQPEGFVDPQHTSRVCKLHRSIYGLKQASQSWNLRFDDAIKQFGFIKNEDEPCVYKKVVGSTVVFLILYVDDILLIGKDIPLLQSVKTWLGTCFSMKDLGEASRILGIQIYRDRSKRLLGLSQSTYIDKVLLRLAMQNSKKGFLPMSHGMSLPKTQGPSSREERDRMD